MAKPIASSFQKGRVSMPSIAGTRPSVHSAQLLVSTGCVSLDCLLGGGLPVGSVLLIEEDKSDAYSKLFLKYFIAEGLVSNHPVLVTSLNSSPEKLTSELPAVANKHDAKNSEKEDDLAIAWRYKNQKISEAGIEIGFGNMFDLAKIMEKDAIQKANISYWPADESNFIPLHEGTLSNGKYRSLLLSIKKRIEELNLFTDMKSSKKTILRLALHSIGSPLWDWSFNSRDGENCATEVTIFLYLLRAIVRSSFSVCVMTVPTHLFSDDSLVKRMEHLTDFVIRLESFQGSEKETNPIFKDYHGLCYVVKLSALNSLVPPSFDSADWVFKLKRHRLIIERLHLPPELSETANRDQSRQAAQQSIGCTSITLSTNIDF